MMPGPILVAVIAVALALAAAKLVLWIARTSHPRPTPPQGKDLCLPPQADTPLARALAPALAAHPGENGIHALVDPPDAFHARVGLVDAARHSIDAQYYLWKADAAGLALLRSLREAARRGVRVRLLLDDNGTAGLDDILSLFNAENNVEVRLFNPFPIRRARVLGYLSDFARLNRRMHNKAMIFDSTVAVLGGRNIGDDYYSNLSGDLFMDMDVAVAGPVVAELCAQFDAYWNAPAAIPLRALCPPPPPARADSLRAAEARVLARPGAAIYQPGAAQGSLADQLQRGAAGLVWARAELLYDPPEKVEGRVRERDMLWRFLRAALGRPQSELVLITPYLVPGRAGLRAIRRFTQAGVRVRVLTNSFAATDVGIVHAGYAHRRRPLLRAGVDLYEYAADAEGTPQPDLLGKQVKGTSPFSRNKLHAKVFAVDRARVFIGSFNFDPRSLRLNTELGIVIHSPEIAHMISDAFNGFIPDRSWRLTLARTQRLRWHRPDRPPLRREPHTTLAQRVFVVLASWLPIEWML